MPRQKKLIVVNPDEFVVEIIVKSEKTFYVEKIGKRGFIYEKNNEGIAIATGIVRDDKYYMLSDYKHLYD